MASLKESSPTGFSYAMAAKGRSPSMPSAKGSNTTISGTTTPASTSIPDSTPASSWADDAEANGVTNGSSNKSSNDADAARDAHENNEVESGHPTVNGPSNAEATQSAVSDFNTEKVEKAEKASTEQDSTAKTVDGESTTKESETTEQERSTQSHEEGGKKKKAAPKPVYHEAKPPPVNPWLQRAADAKAKASVPSTSPAALSTTAPASDADRSRVDPRRKSEQAFNKDSRKVDPRVASNRPRRESRTDETAARRQPLPKRERAQSEAVPAVGNETSWPKPTDTLEDEKKKSQEKEDRTEKATPPAVAKGRPEWKAMPYTPTAVFETQITGRGAGRMGKGVTRGGLAASGRGATSPPGGMENQRPISNAASMPNGEQSQADKTESVKADRDTMPPPPAKSSRASSDGPKDVKTEGGKTLSPITTDMAKAAEAKAAATPDGAGARSVPTPRRNKSPRKDAFPKRNGSVHEGRLPNGDDATAEGINGTEGATPKSAFTERQNQSFDAGAPSFREGKRGGRTKGRGGFNNGPFNGQQFDYQNGAFAMNPSFSPRGSHFPRGGRNNYSHHQSARSQSMAVDQFGRQMPYGYPMMQMTPDFYGPYSAGPYGFAPLSERDFLIGQVSLQLEYYFSIDNLIKDLFLRKHMDSHGWIFLSIVADFNRLKTLTTDYDVVKQACLQSQEIEIRVGEDGKDRVRKVEDWNNFVLKMEERDASAQAEPPTTLRRPSAPRAQSYDQMFYPGSPASAQPQSAYPRMDRPFQMMNGGPPPFMPGGLNQFNEFVPQEESRGRQPKNSHRDNNGASMTNGHSESADVAGEHDNFPTSSIDGLTVVVRKHDLRGAPFHNANSRTFSNGSIDSRNIMEEVTKTQETAPQTNGVEHSDGYVAQAYLL